MTPLPPPPPQKPRYEYPVHLGAVTPANYHIHLQDLANSREGREAMREVLEWERGNHAIEQVALSDAMPLTPRVERQKKARRSIDDKLCAICGVVFTPKNSASKYCSKPCSRHSERLRQEARESRAVLGQWRKPTECVHCKSMFLPYAHGVTSCSDACRKAHRAAIARNVYDRRNRERREARATARAAREALAGKGGIGMSLPRNPGYRTVGMAQAAGIAYRLITERDGNSRAKLVGNLLLLLSDADKAIGEVAGILQANEQYHAILRLVEEAGITTLSTNPDAPLSLPNSEEVGE